jgi:hypothetical protein
MAKDKYHEQVRLALEKDGWTITDDPYQLLMGTRRTYVDLGAERLLIGAERGKEKIAVEIKTFMGGSDLQDFDQAVGQFLRYRSALQKEEPDRKLYLAMPFVFYERFSKICSSWNFWRKLTLVQLFMIKQTQSSRNG